MKENDEEKGSNPEEFQNYQPDDFDQEDPSKGEPGPTVPTVPNQPRETQNPASRGSLKASGGDLRDERPESKLKESINQLTHNIILSKKEIVQEISVINRCRAQNYEEIRQEVDHAQRQRSEKKSCQLESRRRKLEQMGKERALAEVKAKEEEKRRKKQIFQMQRVQRKEKQHRSRDRSHLRERELEKRIVYEDKFKSRRNQSPGGSLTQMDREQARALEEAYIQRIKERLNIGKHKNKQDASPKPHEPNEGKAVEQQQLKGYSRKIKQDSRLKQKILSRIKVRDGSKGAKEAQMKRNYHSTPQIRLPQIKLSLQLNKRKTIYCEPIEKAGSMLDDDE